MLIKYGSKILEVKCINKASIDEDSVQINNERWITIKPHGDDADDYKRLKLEDGETPKDAMERQWHIDLDKKKDKEEDKKEESKEDKKETTKSEEPKKEEAKAEEKKEPKKDEKKDLKEYEVSRSQGGSLAGTKETVTYRSGGQKSSVEDLGDNRYYVTHYDNGKLKAVKWYSTKSGMEKSVREHLGGIDTTPLEKTNLSEKESTYKDVLKKYKQAENDKWNSGDDMVKYRKAWADSDKYKKELTKARREYAESIMANFEKQENNLYEEKQQARKDYYETKSDEAMTRGNEIAQRSIDKMSAIPFGEPIHGVRDRNYREKAWDMMGRSIAESEKSKYYSQKAESVGKAGISSDDANAISKLAEKYKSGVDSAEKRRIIDRVIQIHQSKAKTEALKGAEAPDYSDLGFEFSRNADINRLQLKFKGIPEASTRDILKGYGFRWSPREQAWQRQITPNAERDFESIVKKMRESK